MTVVERAARRGARRCRRQVAGLSVHGAESWVQHEPGRGDGPARYEPGGISTTRPSSSP
jgi:hypothetical protein